MAGRSRLTLDGVNEVFKVVGINFREHEELGGYEAECNGKLFQGRQLTITVQKVLCEIAGKSWVDYKSKKDENKEKEKEL